MKYVPYLDKPSKHYIKSKKPDTKDHIPYDPFIWNIQTRKIHGLRQQIGGCQGLEGKEIGERLTVW
jgi:hypothetical protein